MHQRSEDLPGLVARLDVVHPKFIIEPYHEPNLNPELAVHPNLDRTFGLGEGAGV